MNNQTIKKLIRNISDFPKKDIQFKDITPILNNPESFSYVIKTFSDFAKKNNVTAILGPEARGFIFGSAVAFHLNLKFVPARKPNKLPYKTFKTSYDLEYGSNSLEIHQDALEENDRVMIIDDLVATSGTVNACIDLISQTKAQVVCIAALISLSEFEQHHKFNNLPFLKLVSF